MGKSKVEYLTHQWNFYPGCNHWKTGLCPVGEKCWAFAMAKRFRKGNFEPHLISEKLLNPLRGKQGGRRIGVCFTGDLGGEWVDPNEQIGTQRAYEIWATPIRDTSVKPFIKFTTTLKDIVYQVVSERSQDSFFFLTKNPTGWLKWGKFPDNAWVGATVCNPSMMSISLAELSKIECKHRYISIEPFMERIEIRKLRGIDWLAIGGWSGGKKPVQIEHVREIVKAADKAGIPVFLKDNLNHLFAEKNCALFRKYKHSLFSVKDQKETQTETSLTRTTTYHLRQEFPKL